MHRLTEKLSKILLELRNQMSAVMPTHIPLGRAGLSWMVQTYLSAIATMTYEYGDSLWHVHACLTSSTAQCAIYPQEPFTQTTAFLRIFCIRSILFPRWCKCLQRKK